MRTYCYITEQFLPIEISKAWEFFSSAKNLALITPPEMNFEILTSLDGKEIYEGMLIDYWVRPLFGIRLHWQTEICQVKKPFMFSDRQLKGPYHFWKHVHQFAQKENGVLMKDELTYQLPFGLIGLIAHSLVVRKKVEDIFSFRKEALKKIFES